MDGSRVTPRLPTELSHRDHPLSGAQLLARGLHRLGVRTGYGLLGGALLDVYDALLEVGIDLPSFRHESGAAFAAAEAELATGRPGLVYTTTGPGLLNAINGCVAARQEGAKLILLSGASPRERAGRRPFQDTDPSRQGWAAALCTSGALFDHAALIDHPDQLPGTLRAIGLGLQRTGGFTAHLCLPSDVVARAPSHTVWPSPPTIGPVRPDDDELTALAASLLSERWALWVGYGARHAADEVRRLAARLGLPTICTPRAKGIVDETRPGFLGVTGFGGYGDPGRRMRELGIQRLLVLDDRIGEMESFWRPDLCPPGGLVAIGPDAPSIGLAYPEAPLWPIAADVGATLRALLERVQERPRGRAPTPPPAPPTTVAPAPDRGVRPSRLMDALQRHVVEGSGATVLTEAGNAFAWTTNRLRFAEPGRYRVSTSWGSMGQAAAGVVGVAHATGRCAVAIVGDGALLMHDEINTAVALDVPAIWIVLNDARYGLVEDGMRHLGYQEGDLAMPRVDFAALARAKGARGLRIEFESDLDEVLRTAMEARHPTVVDIELAPGELAPFGGRTDSLGEVGGE